MSVRTVVMAALYAIFISHKYILNYFLNISQWFPIFFHLHTPWQPISINCTLYISKMFVIIIDTCLFFIYLNINQLHALNFKMSVFHASTCFEHLCSKHVEA